MITWEEFKTNKKYWVLAVVIFVILCVICGGRDDRNENKYQNGNQNIITITGHGEVQAAPDIANVSFTIRKEAKTVKDAQTQVSEVEARVLAALKVNNVLEKDIKTVSVSFNPKYEYRYDKQVVPCTQYNCPPNNGNNVIVGYEAYENISIKIRNTDSAGKIIQDLGALGVTDLYGPNFTIDNEDGLKVQARKEAIDDAKNKAKILAKDLEIRLGKMTSFSENGNYPMPMYTNSLAKMDSVSAAGSAPAVLPVGENTISSDVTITYEIK